MHSLCFYFFSHRKLHCHQTICMKNHNIAAPNFGQFKTFNFRLGEEPALSLAALEPPDQHANEPLEVIDWDALQIIYSHEDDGRDEIVDDNRLYQLMGLTAEDEAADKASEAGTRDENGPVDDEAVDNFSDVGDDYLGAAIPVDDDIPGETVVVHDPNKPCMDIWTVYPSMVDFRNAIRQFAINQEFALKTVKSDRIRFIGGCKVQDCRWHIVGCRQPDGKSVMVTVLFAKHNCASSARRKTTTPTSAWVASKAIHYLKKNSAMGPKELRNRLEEEHHCQIPYDTIWKGRQKALTQLHGSWEESFQMLFNWRAEVLKQSPDSVIEIDVKVVDGQEEGHAKIQPNMERMPKCQPAGRGPKKEKLCKRGRRELLLLLSARMALLLLLCKRGRGLLMCKREQGVVVPLLMQSPTKPTMESIIQNSPIRVTRSRLAMLLGGDTASQNNVQTSPTCTTKPLPRKLTPKKLKMK